MDIKKTKNSVIEMLENIKFPNGNLLGIKSLGAKLLGAFSPLLNPLVATTVLSLVIGALALGLAGWALVKTQRLASDSTLVRHTDLERIQSDIGADIGADIRADIDADIDARIETRTTSLEAVLARLDTTLSQIEADLQNLPPTAIDPDLAQRISRIEERINTSSANTSSINTSNTNADAPNLDTAPDTTQSSDTTQTNTWWSFFGDALRITRIDGNE